MSVPSFRPDSPCFALLDDSTAKEGTPCSRLYTSYVSTLTCTEPEQLDGLLERMQQALAQGLYAVGLFPYEFGEQLHVIPAREGPSPLVQILLFQVCSRLTPQEVDRWLEQHSTTGRPAGILQPQTGITESAFMQAIDRIHGYLEAGDTYQVNFTYRLHFSTYGPVVGLYRKLRMRQPVPYGALIVQSDGSAVLSLSPELFLRHEAGRLTAQPMKGTAPASGDPRQDAQEALAMAGDEKSRAENVMIVDLLRNDLGRIAVPGTVQVSKLFEVTRFGSVLQMTSTITAQVRDKVTLAELMRAVYPCGSITGAPKHRTMQIIRELETEARGLYTGAIGWFDAPSDSSSIGDFCLSVPIRTLELKAPDALGLRQGDMGVGAGIVHDSVARQEYEECRLKGRFLTELPHDFELFETMYADRQNGVRHLERHLQRMEASARFFGFAMAETEIRAAVQTACAGLPSGLAHRMRLSLGPSGLIGIQVAPLTPIAEPVRLLRAAIYTRENDLFLRHKTTVRQHYDAAWRAAEQQGAFDTLFCNERGQVTEGGRSNLFALLDGRWLTPPLSAGVLPGVMRAALLDDPAWKAQEGDLTWEDLRRAEEIVVCNALRGALRAEIAWEIPPLQLSV